MIGLQIQGPTEAMSGIAGIEYLGEMRRNKYRTCIKLGMKIINSIFTLVGIAMITYSLWMLKKWYGSHQNLTSLHGAPPRPWFIYTFLSMGMILCFVTFIGHIAIETINRNYLAIYIFSLLLLLILQGGAIARVLLDTKWEDDIPDDPTGRFKQLKEFIKNNLSICKCVGLIALVVQAATVFLAFILRILGPDPRRYCDSDYEYRHFRHDLQQSFLIQPTPLSNANPESRNNVANTRTQENGVEEANFPCNQVNRIRLSNTSGISVGGNRRCVIM